MRPDKPSRTIQRAQRLRRELSLPEALLWRLLKGSPQGLRWRKQHPAGDYVLDFFCARANLAIEVDGRSHDMGDRPLRDERRDRWLIGHRVDTIRIPAKEVLDNPVQVAEQVCLLAIARLELFCKTPPTALRAATFPSQVDGEDHFG